MSDILSDLAKCEEEIRVRADGVRSGSMDDSPGGALLGLHDWYREKELIMAEIANKSDTVKFASGVVSTRCPRYELIPLSATSALASRFERGVRIKGDGAWNALSSNQECADDKSFVLNRLGHAIEHAQKAIARIAGNMQECDPEESADGGDAGAIMFAGALLAEYKSRGR